MSTPRKTLADGSATRPPLTSGQSRFLAQTKTPEPTKSASTESSANREQTEKRLTLKLKTEIIDVLKMEALTKHTSTASLVEDLVRTHLMKR